MVLDKGFRNVDYGIRTWSVSFWPAGRVRLRVRVMGGVIYFHTHMHARQGCQACGLMRDELGLRFGLWLGFWRIIVTWVLKPGVEI